MKASALPTLPRPGSVNVLFGAALALVVAGVLLLTSGADSAWMLWVHAEAPTHPSVVAWSCITVLGLGSSALILVLACDRRQGSVAALLLPTFVLGGLLTHVPKWLLASPRPAATSIASHLHVIGHAFSGPVSMPSGHAVTAAAAAVLFWLAIGRSRPWLALAIGAAAATVAWSRVVVGAHWPSDVFVGAGVGLLTAAIVLRAAIWEKGRRLHAALTRRIAATSGQFAVAAVELAAAIGLLVERTGYPEGQPMIVLLAAVAAVSAVSRCRVALGRRATGKPGRAPAEPT